MDTNFLSLPKIELHLHLDCSLSYDVVKKLNPSITFEMYQQSFIAPPKCTDLNDYLSRAVKGFELMQTEFELRSVTLDLFDQLLADNVIYAEMRFAPLQHLSQGLLPTEVVQIVNDAVTEGIAKTGVQAKIILCTLRHFTEAESMHTVELVQQFAGTHVCAFDIAGNEAGFPVSNHTKAFEFAKQHHIFCTAHAGEGSGSVSVWDTVNHFCPSRIGHGVRSIEDVQLLQHLKTNNIHLEVCVTSNIQTNIYDKMTNHPIDKLYDAGISMSVNTDCRMISNVSLSSEYHSINKAFDWQLNKFLQCNLYAIDHAFCDDALKQILKNKILDAYNNVQYTSS